MSKKASAARRIFKNIGYQRVATYRNNPPFRKWSYYLYMKAKIYRSLVAIVDFVSVSFTLVPLNKYEENAIKKPVLERF